MSPARSIRRRWLGRKAKNEMRICSFLPSGTEILFALDLGDCVHGVTFECDHPDEARSKPVVVYSKLPAGLPEKEIDRQVNDFSAHGESLYRLDADRLREIQPDIIVTQDLCHVCAASPNDLGAVLSSFTHPPQVLALTPHNLEDIWKDIQTVGDACDRSEQAKQLICRIKRQIAGLNPDWCDPPRVLCLEWLDPPFVGGHWVPEMVALAGGIDVLGRVGEPGVPVSWETIVASDPDLILAMPCGYHRDEVEKELESIPFPDAWYSLRAVRNGHVFAMDASSHFSRPGPRVIDGIIELRELLASFTRKSRKTVGRVAAPITAQEDVRKRS
jgi:iron complex transport system substrate-binding protein